jgi:hypothetical protein
MNGHGRRCVHKWTGTHADPFHLGKMGLTFYSFAHDPVTQTSQSRRFGGRLSYLACMQLRVLLPTSLGRKDTKLKRYGMSMRNTAEQRQILGLRTVPAHQTQYQLPHTQLKSLTIPRLYHLY